jgi:hypothetical protein
MSAKSTIEGLIDAACEANANVLHALRKVELARADLVKAETSLVGAKCHAREAEEILRLARAREPREEVTSREVEIARMKGIVLSQGDTLTAALKAQLRDTPALPQFQNDD